MYNENLRLANRKNAIKFINLITLIFAFILTFIINPRKSSKVADIKVVLTTILILILIIVLFINYNNKIKQEEIIKPIESIQNINNNININEIKKEKLEIKSYNLNLIDRASSISKEFKEIDIPENAGDGWFKSYMDPIKITKKDSKQYKFKSLYTDVNGLYMYKDMYVVAMTETHFDVGDEVIVTFDDNVTIKCFIGDVKNKNDPNFNGFGHIHYVGTDEHSSIVEFFVNTKTLEEKSRLMGHVNNLVSHGAVKKIYLKNKIIEE